MLYNMGRYVVTWSTTHSHPPRMTTFSSHAQEQHSKLHFCLQFTLVELMSYSIVLYCGLLLLDYSHRMHEKKSVHAICTEMRSILRGVASEGFHSNMQKKDYRVRILHSRPFIKMRDRYRIQLTMHRCCVDNIASEKIELAGSDSFQKSSSMMLSSIMSIDCRS